MAAALENNSDESENKNDKKEIREIKQEDVKSNNNDGECKPDVKQNFILPSDFYKNLLERAVFSKNSDSDDKNGFSGSVPVFPRNLLYSNYNTDHSGGPSSPNEVTLSSRADRSKKKGMFWF